jgi:hypothetical protein
VTEKNKKWRPATTLKTGRNPKSQKSRNNLILIKMKKVQTIFALLAVVAIMSSCSLTLPVAATSNSVGTKVGTAKATGFLGVLFFNADASIKTAAKNGGITKISTVDIKQGSVLNLIVTYETIVTGE